MINKMKGNPNVEWIRKRKEILQNIEKFTLKGDRVQLATQLSYIHGSIFESMMGMQNWINGWVATELNKRIKITDPNAIALTDSELKDLHEKYKDFATKFIEMDVKITELVNKKLYKKNLIENHDKDEDPFKRLVV
jgi:hypothetical protein